MIGWVVAAVGRGGAPGNAMIVRHLGGGQALDISLGRIVVSLVFCIIVAALAILLVRQRGGKIDLAAIFSKGEPRARAIEVVETRRLSPHADICMVRASGREYLLVLQQGRTQVLSDTSSAAREAAIQDAVAG